MTKYTNSKELAEKFHNLYERLAPSYGYETRLDTRVFDPESKNGQLMIAVCSSIIQDMTEQEAINQDGEEVMDEFEAYFGNPQTTKEVFATLGVSVLMTGLLAVMLVGVANCVQYIWRVIERVV